MLTFTRTRLKGSASLRQFARQPTQPNLSLETRRLILLHRKCTIDSATCGRLGVFVEELHVNLINAQISF